MIVQRVLGAYVRRALEPRFGKEIADSIGREAFARCAGDPRPRRQELSLGGRLMVYCARLTAALYRVLVGRGLEEAAARHQTAAVTALVYDEMAKLPWLIARLSGRTPAARMQRATNAFRRFPFGPPAYVMKDVPANDQVVAFDVERCPVAEYFRDYGLEDLCVESFCNLDYALARKWGGRLERTTTLATGHARCDFRWCVAQPHEDNDA